MPTHENETLLERYAREAKVDASSLTSPSVSEGSRQCETKIEQLKKDYRITVKVRNNRLLKAIEMMGGTTGQKWCADHGLCYTAVNNLINMTESPLTSRGELRRIALQLCEVLDKIPDDLWSNNQLSALERNFSDMEMDYGEVVAMLPAEQQSYLPDFSDLDRRESREIIEQVLSSTLTETEQTVIRLRFEEDLTLEECAVRRGCTRERIRQIEANALRKLRNPKKAGVLVDAADFLSDDRCARIKAIAGLARSGN